MVLKYDSNFLPTKLAWTYQASWPLSVESSVYFACISWIFLHLMLTNIVIGLKNQILRFFTYTCVYVLTRNFVAAVQNCDFYCLARIYASIQLDFKISHSCTMTLVGVGWGIISNLNCCSSSWLKNNDKDAVEGYSEFQRISLHFCPTPRRKQ